MWNIARSAEAMFSRWVVKRAFKFFLKKKLGHVILGDIDIDQLDVQLGEGIVQLSDLALNADYINQKVGTSMGVIVKEGSIGFLSVKMPWKGDGCHIEVDEIELVLVPRMDGPSYVGTETFSGPEGNSCFRNGSRKVDHEVVDFAATPASVDVHEGVKTVAKMVKWFLTSFHVKIKSLLVAFDPCLENVERKKSSPMTLVLRIRETECVTHLSEDVNLKGNAENILGISRLTNFFKFQGAFLELLQLDGIDKSISLSDGSGSTFGELFSGSYSPSAMIPILAGKRGGFSGTLKLSIPWKNGSLDICKVDSEIYMDPLEVKLHPRLIKWTILTCESLRNFDIDRKSHKADSVYYNSASQFNSSIAGSSPIVADKVSDKTSLIHGDYHVELCSTQAPPEIFTDFLLPGSNFISDWVPFSAHKNQKENAEEAGFSASLSQFFDCFDEMRNSHSTSLGSGIWTWTSSVFSAITAASHLASGSLHSPEQQHVHTNLKANIAGISVVYSFDDDAMIHLCSLNSSGGMINFGSTAHFLCGMCNSVSLVLQVCPREMRVDATVKHIEIADYFSDGAAITDYLFSGCNDGIHRKSSFIQCFQSEVQHDLPPFAFLTEDFVRSYRFSGTDFCSGSSSLDRYVDDTDCENIVMNNLVKVTLLTSSSVSCCQCAVTSSYSGDGSKKSVYFSLELAPFIIWVHFKLIHMLLDHWKEVGNSFKTNKRDGIVSEVNNAELGSFSQETVRGDITLRDARLMICFPFENNSDSRFYLSWDQFIVLNFFPPLRKNKLHDANVISHANEQNRYSLTASHSLNLNVGNFEVYIVTSGWKTFCNLKRKIFFAHNVLGVGNENDGASTLRMVWLDGFVTGSWLVKRVKDFASLGNLEGKSKVIGKGREFASVTTMKHVEDSKLSLQRELVMSSKLFIHAFLPPLAINLKSSLYKGFCCILNQAIDGFQCISVDSHGTVEDSSVCQISVLVECDSVEIVIYPEKENLLKTPMEHGLRCPWQRLKLKTQKFEMFFVSNIGRIRNASFWRMGHGEGKLLGSVCGTPDEELLLISCCNSTMKRGDGSGSNAISYGLAGSDIMYLWDPQASSSITSVTFRCCTIVAIGGYLDWLDVISSFFFFSNTDNDQIPNMHVPINGSDDSAPLQALFFFNFVDIGLSYEPYLRNLSSKYDIPKFKPASELHIEGEEHISCLLAAASLFVSNECLEDSVCNEYKIRVRDLGLLLSVINRQPDITVGSYGLEYLHKCGYVKVAEEAFLEATLRINCKNDLLWEVECSESATHIIFDTCHDTFFAIVLLVAQLQQHFSPVVEESLLHLQARWNNVQQAHDKNDPGLETSGIQNTTTFFDSGQTSFLDTEVIECFYRPDLLASSKTLEEIEAKSRTVEEEDLEKVGWYGDACSGILENHFSETGEENAPKQFRKLMVPCTNSVKDYVFPLAKGRILLRNINFRWRMHAGADWIDLKMRSSSVCGRDKTVCLELALSGIDILYLIFPEGQVYSSKLFLSVKDFNLYDNSRDAYWKLVVGYYDSKEHPRESSSKAFKLNLQAVRTEPSLPLDEYRVRIAMLPMLVHLHQVQLNFLINFFWGETLLVDQGIGGSNLSRSKSNNFQHKITEEALLPYFQKFDILPVIVRVDYTPSGVDLPALRAGKYVQLVNLVHWKGVELQLKQVHVVGVYGWNTVFENVIGDWLEDISQNQIHKLLHGLPPIRSLVAVGSGAAKLIYLPVKNYQKDRKLVKGMQRGVVAFLRSISLEAVGLGLHLAGGAHEIFRQAEHISIPSGRSKNDRTYNQPKNAQQGLQQACEKISDGVGRSASALVQVPLKSYQCGGGAGPALAAAVRSAPAAAIAPASAAASAVHAALLGVRNSLDPEHQRESMEKYRGPSQSLGHVPYP